MSIAIVGRVAGHFNSNDGTWHFLGSAYHVAIHLAQSIDPLRIFVFAPFGVDDAGNAFRNALREHGIQVFRLPVTHTPLVTYDDANHEKWELFDYDEELIPQVLDEFRPIFSQISLGMLDLDVPAVIQALFAYTPSLSWVGKPGSEDFPAICRQVAPHLFAAKLNKEESSLLAEFPIIDVSDCVIAEERLKKLGIRRAFLTLGKDGVYYYDEHGNGYLKSQATTKRKVKEAGDAFMAGVLYGMLITKDMAILAKQGIEKSAALLNAMAIRSFKEGNGV